MQSNLPPHEMVSGGYPPGFRLMAPATALIALGTYVLTLAPDLTWSNGALDGVELVVASSTLGIAHPPGYPTYILLGKLFSLLPFGTVAFRYNLFSAVTISLAVGLVTLSIGTLYPRVRPEVAMAAALLFAFSPLVWSQAVVTEVYGLNLLMVASFILLWSRTGASFRSGIFLGLALTTHLTSVLLLPAFLMSAGRKFPRPAAGMIAGLLPLMVLPFLARGDSPVVWGSPHDLAGWLWLASGRLYAANVQPAIDLEHLAGLLRAIIMGPAILLMAGKAATVFPVSPAVIRITSRPTGKLLGLTSVLYISFAIFYKTPDAAVLLVPALMMISILIAPLLNRIGVSALVLPLLLVLVTYSDRDLRQEQYVRPIAQTLLESAPEDALLLTPADRTIFVILYFQLIEGMRTDLSVVDSGLFAFDWYRARLAAQNEDLFIPEADNLVAFQRHNQSLALFAWQALCRYRMNFQTESRPLPSRPQTPPTYIASRYPIDLNRTLFSTPTGP